MPEDSTSGGCYRFSMAAASAARAAMASGSLTAARTIFTGRAVLRVAREAKADLALPPASCERRAERENESAIAGGRRQRRGGEGRRETRAARRGGDARTRGDRGRVARANGSRGVSPRVERTPSRARPRGRARRDAEGRRDCSFRGYDRIAGTTRWDFSLGERRARVARARVSPVEGTHRRGAPRGGSTPRTTWRPRASSFRLH